MKPKEKLIPRLRRRLKKSSEKGFSLMEMIVTIAIMTVLLGSLIPQVVVYIDKANKVADVISARTIYEAYMTLLADSTPRTVPNTTVYGQDLGSIKGMRTTYYKAMTSGGNTSLVYDVRSKVNGSFEAPYKFICITRTEYFNPAANNFSSSRSKVKKNHGSYYLQFNDPGSYESAFISQETNQFLSSNRITVRCMHPENEAMIYARLAMLQNTDYRGEHRDFLSYGGYQKYINRYVIGYRKDNPSCIEIWMAPEAKISNANVAENYSAPIYRIWPNPDDAYLS